MAVDKYAAKAPRLAEWLETNVPEGLTVFALPKAHQRRLRASNTMERLSRELKRRTRVATLFPNTESLMRLAASVVMEITEDWETGRIYLNMNPA